MSGVGRCRAMLGTPLPVSLFRTDVPPKVTHKGDRASTTGPGHNKEVRTMRARNFSFPSRSYALTVLNRVRASRTTAIFNDKVQRSRNHSVSTLRAIRTFIRNTQSQQCGVSSPRDLVFVGHDMLFTRNYENCERMRRTLLARQHTPVA